MLVNPGFEQGAGAGWSASSATGRSLIYAAGFPTPVSPHSGGWAAWLGGADREVASLSQTITPPAGAISATLTYWYWIQSSESSCTYDHAWVEVNGGLLRLHDLCASGNTSGWRQVTLDLTPYLGHPIGLRFYVDTDSSLLSHFFVDDVSLNVQCGGQ
jgi:kumamolisin